MKGVKGSTTHSNPLYLLANERGVAWGGGEKLRAVTTSETTVSPQRSSIITLHSSSSQIDFKDDKKKGEISILAEARGEKTRRENNTSKLRRKENSSTWIHYALCCCCRRRRQHHHHFSGRKETHFRMYEIQSSACYRRTINRLFVLAWKRQEGKGRSGEGTGENVGHKPSPTFKKLSSPTRRFQMTKTEKCLKKRLHSVGGLHGVVDNIV